MWNAPMSLKAVFQSFLVVAVAEVFDKTWFVGVICALRFGIVNAFMGSYSALALHTIIAAGVGYGIAMMGIPLYILHSITFCMFASFFILYTYEIITHTTGGSSIALRMTEAEEEFAKDLGESSQLIQKSSKETDIKSKSEGKVLEGLIEKRAVWTTFLTVFIAEWGDRTQIAMVGLHSSYPVLPIFIGSILAFAVITLSAVLVAQGIRKSSITELSINILSAISFFIFACLSCNDARNAYWGY